MNKRAENKAVQRYNGREVTPENLRLFDEFIAGYKLAERDIISTIESRIAEILGDAQPAPVLRIELRELINKIKEESK